MTARTAYDALAARPLRSQSSGHSSTMLAPPGMATVATNSKCQCVLTATAPDAPSPSRPPWTTVSGTALSRVRVAVATTSHGNPAPWRAPLASKTTGGRSTVSWMTTVMGAPAARAAASTTRTCRL